MPSFTIRQEGQPTRNYRLPPGQRVTVGRSDDAQLVLPDTSVSRRHATLEGTTGGIEITDAGSANGTVVNGKEVVRWMLTDGDVVQIGTFTLTFRDEDEQPGIPDMGASEPIWGADLTDAVTNVNLPRVDEENTSPGPVDTRFDDTPTANLRVVAGLPPVTSLKDTAVIVSVGDTPERWPIGEALTFGGTGVPVRGVLPFGSPPSIRWEDGAHVLRRESVLIPMDVNGHSTRKARLAVGDEIRIGTSRFRYGT